MDDSNALAVREWSERRDDILARAFAGGQSDDQVYELVEREGLDLSPEAVSEKRGELYERTVALRSVEGARLFGHIKALNPAYRMALADSWLSGTSKAIAWALDTDHHGLVPKLMDSGLKALRYMQQEADGIRHSGDIEDRRRTERLSRLSPEARIAIQEHMLAVQEILEQGADIEGQAIVAEFEVVGDTDEEPEDSDA